MVIRARPADDMPRSFTGPAGAAKMKYADAPNVRKAMGDVEFVSEQETLAMMERDLADMGDDENYPGRKELLAAMDALKQKVGAPRRIRARPVDEAPAAPARPSQSDVRASEPVVARDAQAERGALTQKEAVIAKQIQSLEETMMSLPAEARGDLELAIKNLRGEQARIAEQRDRTGIGSGGAAVGGTIGGIGGALGGAAIGGAVAGPPGAIVGGILGSLGGSTAGTALGTWKDLRDGEQISDEQAEALMKDRLIENAIWDVGGNVLFMGGGKAVRYAANTPQGKALLAKYGIKIARSALPDAAQAAAAQKAAVAAERTAGQDDLTQRAVAGIAARTRSGEVPTPGQITGRPSGAEESLRKLHPDDYKYATQEQRDAVEAMRQEGVKSIWSADNATGKELGERVVGTLDDLETAVKRRTGPAFEAARKQQFQADATGVRAEAAAVLQADKLSAESSLKSGERAYLNKLLTESAAEKPLVLDAQGRAVVSQGAEYEFPLSDPQGLLDFISANKAKMREMTAEGEPSEYFVKVLGAMNEQAERAYELAARKAGKGGVYEKLVAARKDYADMIGTTFDKNMKKLIRAQPEKVGELIAAKGNVKMVEDMDRLLAMAEKEGAIDVLERGLIRNEVTKSFLSKQINSVEAAAKFSERMGADDNLRNTYRALMRDPASKGTDELVKLLERQAQIVTRDVPSRANATVLRLGTGAGAGAMGFWMGGLPGAAVGAAVGLNISALTKLIALSQVKGSGVLPRDVALAIRATTPGFAGGRAAAETLKRLNDVAKANGFDLISVDQPQPSQEQ